MLTSDWLKYIVMGLGTPKVNFNIILAPTLSNGATLALS